MTTTACADDWRDIANKAIREAAEWRQNFDVLQRALVGNTGASGIEVAHALRKDAERYRWLRDTKVLHLGPVVGARNDYKGQRYILSSVTIGAAPPDTETLDAAIDAAMQAKNKHAA